MKSSAQVSILGNVYKKSRELNAAESRLWIRLTVGCNVTVGGDWTIIQR
jgi:hypothetical protein